MAITTTAVQKLSRGLWERRVGSVVGSRGWERLRVACVGVVRFRSTRALFPSIHKIYVNLPRSDLRKLSSTKSTAAPPNVIERSVLRGVRWSSEI